MRLDCEHKHANRRINERFERLSGCDEAPESEARQKYKGGEGKAERRRNQVRRGDTQEGRGSGGETWFCTGAGVLVSCNLRRDQSGALEDADAGGAKGHAEGGKRPDSLSCSLQRNALCGMGRVPPLSPPPPAAAPLGPNWHLWEHWAPLS